jgi:K+-transporting ATPase ATPase C chain
LKNKSFNDKLIFIQKNHLPIGINIPKEMIYSSASGLDPDISVEAAKLQVKRVAQARNIDENQILALIDSLKNNRQFFILGEQKINVLLLNIGLDKQNKH